MLPQVPYVRILLVGNEDVGKRCLLEGFLTYQPSAPERKWYGCYERVEVPTKVPDVLFDTAHGGKPQAPGMTPSTLRIWATGDPWVEQCQWIGPHAIGICFSIGDDSGLRGVRDKWYPLVRYLFPGIPILLIGMKKDLREAPLPRALASCVQNDSPRRLSTPREGADMAKSIHASGYIECSAIYDEPSIARTIHALCWIAAEEKVAQDRKWGTGCIIC